jgi:lysophospholipase L1-like esterase
MPIFDNFSNCKSKGIPMRPFRMLLLIFIAFIGYATESQGLSWEQKVAKKLSGTTPSEGSFICIGSSHMANWKTIGQDLAPLTIWNAAIPGSTMKLASELFAEKLAIPFKPRAIMLYEGSNDIAAGQSPQQILTYFQEFYRKVRSSLPATRLYVLGIVPSPGKRFDDWKVIEKTNATMKAECGKNPWMTYIDITTPLLGADGKPKMECFIPGDIHMNAEGYKILTEVISKVVVPVEREFQQK